MSFWAFCCSCSFWFYSCRSGTVWRAGRRNNFAWRRMSAGFLLCLHSDFPTGKRKPNVGFGFCGLERDWTGREDDYIIPEEDDGAIPQEDDSFIPEEDDGAIPEEDAVLLQHSDSGGDGAGFSMESGGSGKTKADRKKKKKRRTVSEFFHSVRQTWKRFLARCRQTKDMLCRGKALLEDEINQRSVRLIFRELRYLLRHSGFRRFRQT